jgi:hypothetical protein
LIYPHNCEADKAVPQKLLDMCAFIEDLLAEDAWQAKLKKHHKLLDDVFSKKSVKDSREAPCAATRADCKC